MRYLDENESALFMCMIATLIEDGQFDVARDMLADFGYGYLDWLMSLGLIQVRVRLIGTSTSGSTYTANPINVGWA